MLPRTSTSANNEFVAGFVGVSNIVERGGRRFTIRPEKVRILEDGEVASDGLRVEDGHVRDVAYIGAVTRFAVDLDAGGEIQVVSRTSRCPHSRRSSSGDGGCGSPGTASTPTRSPTAGNNQRRGSEGTRLAMVVGTSRALALAALTAAGCGGDDDDDDGEVAGAAARRRPSWARTRVRST